MIFTNHGKKGLMLKTSLAIFYMKMHKRKVLLMKTSKTWPHFPKTFFQNLNSCDLISWNFIDSPHIILEKSPRNQNLRFYFKLHLVPGLQKIGTFYRSFYFHVFPQKLFFPWLSYKDTYFMIFAYGFINTTLSFFSFF